MTAAKDPTGSSGMKYDPIIARVRGSKRSHLQGSAAYDRDPVYHRNAL